MRASSKTIEVGPQKFEFTWLIEIGFQRRSRRSRMISALSRAGHSDGAVEASNWSTAKVARSVSPRSERSTTEYVIV